MENDYKMTETIIIAAIAKNNVIGKDNKIPWYISEDFKHFKELTKGYPIIMGKNTFLSLPKKPLPERENIVITFANDSFFFDSESVIIKHSLEDAIDYAKTLQKDKIFIIGGASVYKQAMEKNIADILEITIVDGVYDGDTYFPEINKNIWNLVREDKKEGYSFNTYVRE